MKTKSCPIRQVTRAVLVQRIRFRSRGQILRGAALVCLLGLLSCLPASAATLLVWPGSPSPTAPYATWATAARTIQAAVDVAQAGDTVLVTNGVYATGGRAVDGTMTNRVAVTKPLVVQSLNGPEMTLIQGYQVPGTTNGDGAIRCIYLASGAVLSGFTLTNGATRRYFGDYYYREQVGGGACCESTNAVVTNCTFTGNSASLYGGAACWGTLNNSSLTGNSVELYGGGACSATLNNCMLSGNSAVSGGGGGTSGSTMNNCIITDNSARGDGGGASAGTLNNCSVSRNFAWDGGGVSAGTLNNCSLTSNSAETGGGASGCTLSNSVVDQNWAFEGGGVFNGTLDNCMVTGNVADTGGGASTATLIFCLLVENQADRAGGAYNSTLTNCTLIRNQASLFGGGAYYCILMNCILYFNDGWKGWGNHYISTLSYCCTDPLPLSGPGNITGDPLFVLGPQSANFRLLSNSPCIDAGFNAFAPGTTDLDGRPRIVGGTVDIGAYEYQGPGFGEFIPWLAQCRLATDGSADDSDSDGDGLNNWQEWLCGTDPTNPLSVLRLLLPARTSSGVMVTWSSVIDRAYFLECSTNLGANPAFSPLATGIPGQAGTTTYTDTNGPTSSPCFYRVGITP